MERKHWTFQTTGILGSPRFTNDSARAMRPVAAFHDTRWFMNMFTYFTLLSCSCIPNDSQQLLQIQINEASCFTQRDLGWNRKIISGQCSPTFLSNSNSMHPNSWRFQYIQISLQTLRPHKWVKVMASPKGMQIVYHHQLVELLFFHDHELTTWRNIKDDFIHTL